MSFVPTYRVVYGYLFSGLWLLCGLLGVVACDQKTELEKTPELLDRRREMLVQRTDQGRSATIQFFTRYPAYCKVEYWPAALGDNPAPGRRKTTFCFRKNPGQTHFVRLERLASDRFLYVRLLASSSDSKVKRYDDSMVLKETSSHYSYFPPENVPSKGEDDLRTTVIKANLTQASASVYSHLVPEDEFEEEKRLFTSVDEGCRSYKIVYPSSLMPPRDVGVSKVSSSGYYSTNGVRIDKGRGIFLLEFTGKIESAERWFFKFLFHPSSAGASEEHEVIHGLPSPPELRAVRLDLPEEMVLETHDLMTFTDPKALDKSRGLQFSWQAKNISEKDYFEVLIGKPSQGAAVKCQYPARSQILEVPAADLGTMTAQAWDVIVSLNRRVVSEPKQGHVVFLHSHDWRHLSVVWR